MISRRAFLKALGVGTLSAPAGFLFADKIFELFARLFRRRVTIEPRYIYASIRIEKDVLEGDRDAFYSLLDAEMEGMKRDMEEYMNRLLMG